MEAGDLPPGLTFSSLQGRSLDIQLGAWEASFPLDKGFGGEAGVGV